MLTAIVSDIHSNLAALEAVLRDAEEQKADRVVCLGDVIGYGPQPLQCVDIARKQFEFTILGNHEEAVLYGAVGFNPKAKAAVDWTRDQFHLETEDEEDRNARWQFLGDMPISVEGEDGSGVQFVHGSPRDPTREYVFPTDVLNPEKIYGIFEHVERVAFNGHTHAPGVMTESGLFKLPQDGDNEYVLEDEKVIINVGSTGQPRDGNNKSSYALFDGERVIFRRVAYDIDKTIELMSKIDRLPEYLALRLKEGR
ncbi:MAG: metallophosphoesterase [Planctomycetota bacterium]|nr:MAG: metallophosphoesterase [Planctomycetota bacterium]